MSADQQKVLFSKPKLLIYLPPDPARPLHGWDDKQKNRDFLLQGELLRFYLIVSFTRMNEVPVISSKKAAKLGEGVAPPPVQLKALRLLFSRLKFHIQFQDLKQRILPTEQSVKVVGYKPLAKAAASGSDTSQSSPKVPYDSEELLFSPKAKHQVLENGDYAFPLQTVVAVSEKYLNEKLHIVVSAQPLESLVNEEDILHDISFHEKQPPVRYIGRQIQLLDPLAVTFTTTFANNKHFVTMCIENGHHEELTVTDLGLHLSSTNLDAHPTLPIQTYKANLLEPNLPVKLQSRESHHFVLVIDPYPLNPEQVTQLPPLKPSILVTWVTPAVGWQLQSQFTVPIPPPQGENLFMTIESDKPTVSVNTVFSLQFTVSNLSAQATEIQLELLLPTSIKAFGDDDKPSTAQTTPGVLFVEKVIDIGKIEPHGEITSSIQCMPIVSGLYEFDKIGLRDKKSGKVFKPMSSPQILVEDNQ